MHMVLEQQKHKTKLQQLRLEPPCSRTLALHPLLRQQVSRHTALLISGCHVPSAYIVMHVTGFMVQCDMLLQALVTMLQALVPMLQVLVQPHVVRCAKHEPR